MKGVLAVVGGLILAPVILVAVLFGGEAPECSGPGNGSVFVDVASIPDVEDPALAAAPGIRAEQLTNAVLIMNAAYALGMDARAQEIGVMTALGESTLRNIDYGDDIHGVTNPDGSPTCSLGLFQQQWCLGWGTREQVLDPTYAATKFFQTLADVPGWQEMEPTIAAHRVQRNADSRHYEKYHPGAVRLVAALAGVEVTQACTAGDEDFDFEGPAGWGGYANGRIPLEVMRPIPWAPHQVLRPDATSALISLNNAYRAEFGVDMVITDAYRDFDAQVRLKALKPALAAPPGTSNHGWGLAVDFGGGINRFGTVQHSWMQAMAPQFGWVHPQWAQINGSLPEAWHWEFEGRPS